MWYTARTIRDMANNIANNNSSDSEGLSDLQLVLMTLYLTNIQTMARCRRSQGKPLTPDENLVVRGAVSTLRALSIKLKFTRITQTLDTEDSTYLSQVQDSDQQGRTPANGGTSQHVHNTVPKGQNPGDENILLSLFRCLFRDSPIVGDYPSEDGQVKIGLADRRNIYNTSLDRQTEFPRDRIAFNANQPFWDSRKPWPSPLAAPRPASDIVSNVSTSASDYEDTSTQEQDPNTSNHSSTTLGSAGEKLMGMKEDVQETEDAEELMSEGAQTLLKPRPTVREDYIDSEYDRERKPMQHEQISEQHDSADPSFTNCDAVVCLPSPRLHIKDDDTIRLFSKSFLRPRKPNFPFALPNWVPPASRDVPRAYTLPVHLDLMPTSAPFEVCYGSCCRPSSLLENQIRPLKNTHTPCQAAAGGRSPRNQGGTGE